MAYGKGYRPSPSHHLGLGHPEHLSEATIPHNAEVVMPACLDQGNTQSCTGNGGAVVIQVAMSHAANLDTGKFVALPSRLFLYYHARFRIGEQSHDEGAMVSDIFTSAAKLGVPPESAWTFSEALDKITAQPDPDAYHQAADQKIEIAGGWRITSTGSNRVKDVQRAIASDDPVVLGLQLDQRFEDLLAGHVWPGRTGQSVGGHCIVASAYRTTSSGRIEFKIHNSWGTSWCEEGSCWVDSDAIASPEATDLWIADAVPVYSYLD
jgi:Papain family cysteine protease